MTDPEREVGARSRRRQVTVYDAVAGRAGPSGTATNDHQQGALTRFYGPRDVLLRSVNAPEEIPDDFYDAESGLKPDQVLPDSDLVKAIHAYASDFYERATSNRGEHDFKSFDETALLAMGILLEEAATELLGKTGDMALVERDGLEHGLPESKRTKHQIQGRVKPLPVSERVENPEDNRAKRRKLRNED
jgi:UAF complex subunit Rrn10